MYVPAPCNAATTGAQLTVTSDCNSGSTLRDAVGSFYEKELIRLWNSILHEPRQSRAKLSKLKSRTAFKKTQHTKSRWHRTVYISGLVAAYDTHNSKC